MTSKFLSLLR